MTKSRISEIISNIHALQEELEKEVDRLLQEKREIFRYTLEKGKVRFEQGIRSLQRRQKTGIFRYLWSSKISHVLTSPVIYSVLVPMVILDIVVTLYQHICFRIYRIPLVKRKKHIVIDRHHLAYLNIIEKVNCVYCSYCNGVIEYVREVAGRTEQYWCPIKHARRTPDPHRFVDNFVDYGDAEGYKAQLITLKGRIAEDAKDRPQPGT